ncbi:unnamed protein product [Phytophthora lilii]|uniref:Unnamed protein product n=1 Tax=Phytophthora lilii TaxID=2077276 RepID=A0A9W7CS42_9STRA|nr:unnamed protein product [Phytophthora lilii]
MCPSCAEKERELAQLWRASWASDVASSITTLPKKNTESMQTDISVGPHEETPDELKIPLSEILRKKMNDENSQTNPDTSTPNVRPVMIDVGVDSGVQMVKSLIVLIKLIEIFKRDLKHLMLVSITHSKQLMLESTILQAC